MPIAHRLPPKKLGESPVLVRLARRAGKLQLLRNKKALSNKIGHENVKVIEDLTAPRVRFFNIIKLIPEYFQHGHAKMQFFYVWKEDSRIYSFRGFYEGGCFLQYTSNVMMSCFYPRNF